MTTKITTELLEALLSPDAHRRGQAEEFFQGLPLLERATGLLQIMLPTSRSSTNVTVASLAAVLLRRDILRITDVQAMEPMIQPLLDCFLVTADGQQNNTVRIAIGHCLAEICGAVALLSPSPKDKEQVMARILNAISNAVSIIELFGADIMLKGSFSHCHCSVQKS
jgi:hypothetical protein